LAQLIVPAGLSKTVGVEELNAGNVRVHMVRSEPKPTQMAVPSQDLVRDSQLNRDLSLLTKVAVIVNGAVQMVQFIRQRKGDQT
jgi:hypothetical protein